jgi:tetratricopeptide (TPR) repeat protein
MATSRICRLAARSLTTIALGSVLLVAAPVARAQKPAAAPLRDPANVTGLSQAMEAVVQGNDMLVARDAPGAIEAYRRAIKLQPKNPIGYLMLGQALVTTNELVEAESALKEGEALADPLPALKARILFSLADLKERQKKLDEAKAAWQRYAEYANQKSASAFAATATARIAAIDEVAKQDKAYESVRQRIADESKK